jgi:RND family efflux transporter MFP subunit
VSIVRHITVRTFYLFVCYSAAALSLAACDRLGLGSFQKGSEAISAEQEDEAKTAQITVWTDRYEIFLEHQFLVVNAPTRFITHVTDLVTLEPRRKGPVTFVLRQGTDTQVLHIEPQPAREGIYLPDLTFAQPGTWSVALRIPRGAQEDVVALPPLTVFASRAEAANAPDPVVPEGITFLKEQQWKLRTQTTPVHSQQVTEQLRVPGTVLVRPGHQATVVPPVAGQFMPPPDGTLPFLGTRVHTGQTLARVEPHLVGTELLTFFNTQQQIHAMEVELTVNAASAEAEALRARAALNHAQQGVQRIQALRQQRAKSARELEEARYALSKAKADLAATEALTQTYTKAKQQLAARPRAIDHDSGMPAVPLSSPIDGYITAVNATVGEHLSPDHAVFTILDTTKVLIEAQLPETDIIQLRTTQGASYTTADAPETFIPILDGGGGRLVTLGSTVNSQTRRVPIVFEVPNPDGRLRIGMALEVYVATAQVEEALVIPTAAVVEEDGGAVAFVQVAGETFARRDLTLGIRDGGVVQVLSGLTAGERVVTQGAYAVRLASVSSTLPAHGHAH